jgi:ABC-type microcin C transport system permease subunit YejE
MKLAVRISILLTALSALVAAGIGAATGLFGYMIAAVIMAGAMLILMLADLYVPGQSDPLERDDETQ